VDQSKGAAEAPGRSASAVADSPASGSLRLPAEAARCASSSKRNADAMTSSFGAREVSSVPHGHRERSLSSLRIAIAIGRLIWSRSSVARPTAVRPTISLAAPISKCAAHSSLRG